jgi:hypothetical protein
MKTKQTRIGVFETNSSSTHSITICLREEFERWKNGELIYSRNEEKLIPTSEAPETDEDNEYQTYEQYDEDYDSGEAYEENYTTPKGEELTIFGKFGYN